MDEKDEKLAIELLLAIRGDIAKILAEQRGQRVDPDDAPELTDEFFEDAELFHGNTFIRRGRGRPATGNARELISVRLDKDVLAKLREAGPGWQSQINMLLREALKLGGREAA